MANVIIKSDERKEDVNAVLRSFGKTNPTLYERQMAEEIAVKSKEAINNLRRMEAVR